MTNSEIIRISPSQLNVWLNCPQAWEYGYVDKLKAKGGTKQYLNVGTYVHENMHFYFHLLQAGYTDLEFIRSSMINKFKTDLEKLLEDGEIPSSDAMAILKKASYIFFKYIDYQTTIIDAGISVENVEHKIEVEHTLPTGQVVVLNGIVDLLYSKAGRRIVRDHKSGENARFYSLEKTKATLQLWFYVIIYHYLGISVDQMEISFLSTYDYKPKKGELEAHPEMDQLFKYYPTEITPTMIEVMAAWLDNTIDVMLNSKIYRNIHPGCTQCGFWPLCKTEMRGISSRGILLGNYERKPDAEIPNEYTTGIADPFEVDNLTFSG